MPGKPRKKGEDPPTTDTSDLRTAPAPELPTTLAMPEPDAPSIRKVLDELALRRAKLDKLDTRISELIKRVEAAMRLHFSVRISTTIDSQFHDETGIETFSALVYGKWDSKWQLLVQEGMVDDPDSWRTTPLVSAPRDMRARVFLDGFVEKLIRNAVKQLDEEIEERERALTSGIRLAEALEPSGPVKVALDADFEEVDQ